MSVTGESSPLRTASVAATPVRAASVAATPVRAASVAATDSRRRWRTETERNWLLSAVVVVASIALFAAIHRAEIRAGRWNPDVRIVRDPAGTAMGCLGIAHFLIAFVFTASSRRMKSGRAWGRYALLAAAGTLLCLGYARLGLAAPFAAELLFFAYFFVHESRDEVFFYFVNGDGPAAARGTPTEAALVRVPLILAGAIVAVLTLAIDMFGEGTSWIREEVEALPEAVRWSLGAGPSVVVLVAALVFVRRWRRAGLGSLRAFVRAHAPILRVFAASFTILAVGFALGWRAHTIVLLHVAAWFVFSVRQLQKRPVKPRPAPGTWSWLRATPIGFTVLHAGLAAVLLAAAAVWAYAFRHDPRLLAFRLFLDQKSFAYWTIVHVSVSFMPR